MNGTTMRLIMTFVLCMMLSLSGCGKKPTAPVVAADATWSDIETQAKGSTVKLSMWDGDPMINAYMRDYVIPALKEQHDVTLQLVGGQGDSLVNKLLVDKEAGRNSGDVDLMWINGETFYQLRKMDALYGPFTNRLPNNKYVDWDSPFVSIDFQKPVEGYECPWGNVQLAIIYNSARVVNPPKNRAELTAWIKENPGRFTFDNSFTGMTFLKSLLYDIAGGPESLKGDFNETVYKESSAKLWDWLREVQPMLWRKGETFPEGVAQLHQLMSNGEVDFTMSCNDGEVDNKVVQGVLPETSKAYILESGTIRNSHYMGIPFNAPNKAGAMVVANFFISPDAQLKKATPEVWGDGTVLSIELLPEEWKGKFEKIPGRSRVPARTELEKNALQEPASEIMVRLHADFRKEIIEHGR